MPEREQIVRLIRANAANHDYFFDELEDPSWLGFLAREGFFTHPPDPERGEDWVRFPGWSESRYLARIASREPEMVAEIVAKIPASDNVRVREDIAEIAAALPARFAVRLTNSLTQWLSAYTGPLLSLPGAVAELIVELAERDQVNAALDLAAALLAISQKEMPGAFAPRSEPVAKFDNWGYARALERISPALMAADAERAFGFLCALLADAVAIETGHRDTDYTYISRPSISDHAQNHGLGLIDSLVVSLREAALAESKNPQRRKAVLDALAGMKPPIFQRLSLYVVQECGSTEQVFARLADPEVAASVPLWHEYGELLRNRYAELDAGQRNEVLAVLRDEPAHDLPVGTKDNEASRSELERERRSRLFRRLAVIAEQLEGPDAETYGQLCDQFGEPDHPTFLSYTSSFTGPTSPFTLEQLRELGPLETVNLLRDWEPPGGFSDPTPEGLARILEEASKESPSAYAETALAFTTGVEPTYVRGILGGLSDAAKDEVAFPWEPVLSLCRWVLDQPRSDEPAEEDLDRDTSWGWTRKTIAGLLSHGFGEGAAEIPHSERESVWPLLSILAEDPEPTPEHEERYGGENMDPATLALNTTRGEALNAVVRYCLWVKRELDGAFDGFRSMPEAQEILELHLDPAHDPSLAVRSVYGRWFPHLLQMDEEWTRSIAHRVFPKAKTESELFAAAWDAFIVFTTPWVRAFRILEDAYSLAIKRIGTKKRSRSFAGDPRHRLGGHLMAFRAGDEIDLEPDGLFASYWKRAPVKVRASVVRNAGWSLEQGNNLLEPEVVARLMETWEWIAVAESDEDSAQVLAEFGAWLGAPGFDPAWLLQQASGLLARQIPLDPSHVVFESLPRLAATDLKAALTVLRGMLLTDRQGWAPIGSREEIRNLLEMGVASENLAIRAQAGQIVDQLLGLGLRDFRDLATLAQRDEG